MKLDKYKKIIKEASSEIRENVKLTLDNQDSLNLNNILQLKIIDFLKNHIRGAYRYMDFESPASIPSYRINKTGLSYYGDFSYIINEKEIQTNDCSKYLPHVLIPSLPNISKCERLYEQYVQKITEDVHLIIQLHVGSISGVGYDKGWSIQVGIHYYGAMISVYYYKTSNGYYEIQGIVNDEFYQLIDFSNFKLTTTFNKYLSEYTEFYDCKNKMDYDKFFNLYIEDNTFSFYDSFFHVFEVAKIVNDKYEKRKLDKIYKSFKELNFENFVVKDIIIHFYDFKLPDSCKRIIFDYNDKKRPSKYLTHFTKNPLQSNIKALLNYSSLFEDSIASDIAKKIKKNNNLLSKFYSHIIVELNYKGVFGRIITNKLAFENMEKYYSNYTEIEINILGNVYFIDKNKFFDAIKIKPLKKENYNNEGCIDWWLTEFDKETKKEMNEIIKNEYNYGN